MTEKLTGAMKTLLNGAATICSVLAIGTFATQAAAETLTLEKDELKFGFIKLTDMAPLAIAKELGYFEDEGLYVTLEPQANWKVLLDRVITGELDGAHMLAGQPLAATIGFGTKAHIVTPFSMDLNGNAITVSNAVWADDEGDMSDGRGRQAGASDQGRRAEARDRQVQGRGQDRSTWAWSSRSPPTITSCATGSRPASIHPGFYSPSDVSGQIKADVLLSVTPPPQMPATLEAGTIHRLLRRRAVEPGRRVQGHRRARRHRLRDLEEQPGEGVRHHRGVRGSKSQHDARAHQGADPRRHVARRKQQRQPDEGGRDPVASPNMSAPMRRSSPTR